MGYKGFKQSLGLHRDRIAEELAGSRVYMVPI